ncbi:MAG: TIGR01777 family oxidoreductase [Bacteroidales bacterium]
MTKVLITGGTGLVGTHLGIKLQELGYEIAILSRNKRNENKIQTYFWNYNKNEIDKDAINTSDYIIHLAGENLGERRWTSKRKQLVFDSRIKSAELIYNNIDKGNNRLRAFITASAIGYYGAITSDKIFSETEPPSDDFLGQTCKKWEQVADRFTDIGIRTVKIRTGVVLAKQGGVLSKIIIPIKLGIGSAIGDGNQYFPWIHIDDLCSIYIKAIEDTQMIGAFNAVAPEHKTNKQFIETVARNLDRPLWFPKIPAIAIKVILGKMSEMILTGSRISSDKIKNSGFVFRYPNLESALKQLEL